jgi:hypothetical protein
VSVDPEIGCPCSASPAWVQVAGTSACDLLFMSSSSALSTDLTNLPLMRGLRRHQEHTQSLFHASLHSLPADALSELAYAVVAVPLERPLGGGKYPSGHLIHGTLPNQELKKSRILGYQDYSGSFEAEN